MTDIKSQIVDIPKNKSTDWEAMVLTIKGLPNGKALDMGECTANQRVALRNVLQAHGVQVSTSLQGGRLLVWERRV